MTRRIIPNSKVKSFVLRSYAPQKPKKQPTAIIKTDDIVTTQRADRVWRNRFGRAISMDRIELALNSANRGSMRDLTDLSRETIDTDPHLGSVLNKRMGAVSSLPWEVQPAEGFGIDKKKALYYAEVVREQILNLPKFRQNLNQIAWALFDGRMALEIDWTELTNAPIKDKKFGSPILFATNLGWIHPRRISFGPTRQLIVQDEEVMYEGGNFNTVGLDISKIPYKFIQYTPQRYGEYPEREGLSPRCMYWSFFKRFAARERMILVELFGKPWRIIEVDQESTAGGDELTQADANVDGLGSSYTARMPRGTKLNVVQPGRTAGQVHQETIKESDSQMSKLVLGQTGTTDGVPAGLNSSQANVMQDEQLMILKMDAADIQEIIESQLTDPIIALNFGEQERPYAPKFLLRSDLPADRNSELERLDLALKAGLEISMTEAYEVSGFRIPNREDVIIRLDQPSTPSLAPVPPAPRPVLIYPNNTSPEAGEQQPSAAISSTGEGEGKGTGVSVGSADIAKIITVDEARAGQGLPPIGDERGRLTVAEFEKQMSKSDKPKEPDDDRDPEGGDPEGGDPEGNLPDPKDKKEDEDKELEEEIKAASKIAATIKKVGDKWVVFSEDGSKSFGSYDTKEEAEERLKQIERFKNAEASKVFNNIFPKIKYRTIAIELAGASAQRLFDKHICEGEECNVCASVGQNQPETELGSPETILKRGQKEIYRAIQKWVNNYTDAVKDKSTIPEVMSAIATVGVNTDIAPLARAFERRMIQSLALGALDSGLEIGEDLEESEEEFETLTANIIRLADVTDFSNMRFEDAVRFFKDKEVLSKATFEKLSMAAKQRAFTVAGTMDTQLLTLIRDELTKTIAKGADIRQFRKFIKERVKTAGFIPTKIAGPLGETLSAAHTDTVFRTNVLNAYNSGRVTHQTQPNVIARRPVWEMKAIQDGRARTSHKVTNGKRLLATDSFWQTAYPPYGFNCLLPDNIIEGQICGASKAFYSGKAFQITTMKGRSITITANHPILTQQGWIVAQSICNNDELVCYSGETGITPLFPSSQSNEYQTPSFVQDVFSSLSKPGISTISLYASYDFHSEAQNFIGDIDVVGTYRDLAIYRKPFLDKEIKDLIFKQSSSSRSNLIGSGPSNLSMSGIDTPSSSNPSSVTLSMDKFGVTFDKSPFSLLRLGSAAKIDTVLRENTGNNLSADIILASQLLDRSTTPIVLDKVVNIREFNFSGHVYDLHSPLGWVIASGVVTSNCRCRVITRSSKTLDTVVSGSTIRNLPDQGFSSGTSFLL